MRRLAIYLAAASLYAAMLAVTWSITSRQAWEKTQSQLDFSVRDLHNTLAGAIDTMLSHIASTAVRHVGTAHFIPMDHMKEIARELDIDELCIISREGIVISSNDPHSIDVDMTSIPVLEEFMALTNGTTTTVSQPFRPHANNPQVRSKYLGAPFPGGDGYVQVGLYEGTLQKMLPAVLGSIFDEWLLGNTGFFLCADRTTGKLFSNPSRHRNEAKTLAEAGYDVSTASEREFLADGKATGVTFVQTLFGEKCFCRAFLFAGHRFVAALPKREFFGTRTMLVSVLAVLLFGVLAAFTLSLDRIFRDSDRLKKFYAAEDDRRAKDMEIAKTIQDSALPRPLPDSPCFRIEAAMQTAREVGGDFYDYFPLDATHLAFLVADVSGKGITAALYMMTAKTLIKNKLLAVRDPASALTEANEELCANNPASMFLTAWVGVLDLESGIVTFANAGHNPPVMISGSQPAEYVRKMSGPLLAFIDDAKYAAQTVKLGIGDALFLYTDGVTEAMDEKGELFGEQRTLEALNAVETPDAHALCGVVRSVVAAFSEGLQQADDMTVLAVRYLRPPTVYSRAFQPTQEGIAAASRFLDDVLGKSAWREARVTGLGSTLHVILDEACSNIVKHSGATDFTLDIEIMDSPSGVRITFSDDGTAYDPLAHLDPDTTLPASERAIGGLGILMIKKMASSVQYHRSRSRNFLVVERTEQT